MRTIAILLIVMGGCDLVLGLALSGAAAGLARGGLLPALDPLIPAAPRLAVLVFAPALVLAGALKVVAGVRNHQYRSPRLGKAALASCLVSSAHCACAPAAILLMVAGLVRYGRPDAQGAFQMRAQGLSREWIDSVGTGA